MLIYQILHVESGHKYYGQTTRPKMYRFREHLYSLRAGKHPNRYLQASWNKYGEDAFSFDVIVESHSIDELNRLEQDLIKNDPNAFNLAPGGNAHIHSEATKKAIGDKNKIPIVGMNIKNGEFRHYLSAVDTVRDGFNPACVRKCACVFVSHRPNGLNFRSLTHRGWVWTEDLIKYKEILLERAILGNRAKIRTERPIIGRSLLDGTTIHLISSAQSLKLGLNPVSVYRCATGRLKAHGNYVFVFADIANPQSLLRDRELKATSKTKLKRRIG